MVVATADPSNGIVELVLTARDNISAVTDKVAGSLGKVKDVAASTAVDLASMSAAILSLGAKGVGVFENIYNALEKTDKILRSIGTSLPQVFSSISESLAQELIEDGLNRPLTETLSTLGKVGRLGLGLKIETGDVSGTSDIEGQISSIASKIQSSDQISSSIQKLFQSVNASIRRGSSEAIAQVGAFANAVDLNLQRAIRSAGEFPQEVIQRLNVVSAGADLFSGFSEAENIFSSIRNQALSAAGAISEAGSQLFFIQQAFSVLQSTVTQAGSPFDLLIGQNIRLKEQLLSTQSSLVSTNKILQDGQQVNSFTTEEGDVKTGATARILALKQPVEDAIASIRKGSQELVGVTSSQLIESFQIIAGQAGSIGISLQQSADLTLSFAAALGTLGVPLFQARQEIGSILQGTIDQNSVVAKSLNISNQQVAQWKSQGKLVQELTARLGAFREGNALAAKTIGGLTSNIQEVIENVGLAAGSELVAPIEDRLDKFYKYLQGNQDVLTDYVTILATKIFNAVEGVVDGLQRLFKANEKSLLAFFDVMATSGVEAIEGLGSALNLAADVLQPFFSLLEAVSASLRGGLGPFFVWSIQAKILAGSVGVLGTSFQTFLKLLPGVGDAMYVLSLRTSGVVGALTSLTSATGPGIAGILTLGSNLDKIPGATALVAKQFPFMGEQIAGLIPTLATAGTAFVALQGKFPGLGQFITDLGVRFPTLGKAIDGTKDAIKGVAEVAAKSEAFGKYRDILDNVGNTAELNRAINERLATSMKAVRNEIIATTVKFALIGAAVYLAVMAFNRFVLENQALMDALRSLLDGLGGIVGMLVGLFDTAVGKAVVAVGGLTAAILAMNAAISAGVFTKIAASIATFVQASVTAQAAGTSMTLMMKLGAIAGAAYSAAIAGGATTLGALGAAALATTAKLGAMAVATLAAAAPWLVLAAAILAVAAAFKAKQLAESNQTTEKDRKETEAITGGLIKTLEQIQAQRRKENDLKAKGIALSAEDVAKNKQLEATLKTQQDIAKNKLNELKALRDAMPQENRGAYDEMIKQLERFIALGQKGSNITLAPLDLKDKGTVFQDLARQVQEAQAAIANPASQQALDENAKKLIEVTKKELELGAVTESEAAARLQSLARNSKVDTNIRLDAFKTQQANLAQNIQKTLDITRQGELQRQNELKRLELDGLITKEEADQKRLEEAAKVVDKEIELEKKKYNELLKDGEVNLVALRESQTKQLELTQKRLQLEEQLYEAQIKVIRQKLEERARIAENATTRETQGLQRQLLIYDSLNRMLDERNKLVAAGKGLADALSDFQSNTLSILERTETSEFRKKQLAEAAAKVKLDAVQIQQKYELESLRIAQEQQRLALERKAVELEIAEKRKQNEIQRADIDVQIAEKKVKDQPQNKQLQLELETARLKKEGLELDLAGIRQERQGVSQQQQNLPELQELERRKVEVSQRNQLNDAEASAIEAIRSPAERRRALRQLRERLSQQAFGDSYSDVRRQGSVSLRDELQESGFNVRSLRGDGLTVAPETQRLLPALEQGKAGILPAAGVLTAPKPPQEGLAGTSLNVSGLTITINTKAGLDEKLDEKGIGNAVLEAMGRVLDGTLNLLRKDGKG